jgi:hypothetical protein
MASGFANSFFGGEGMGMIFYNNTQTPWTVYAHARSIKEFSDVVHTHINSEKPKSNSGSPGISISLRGGLNKKDHTRKALAAPSNAKQLMPSNAKQLQPSTDGKLQNKHRSNKKK